MRAYASLHKAVIDLHERGFNQDFGLAEGGIRWVQQKVVLRLCDCSVIEYHRIQSGDHPAEEIIILGILSFSRSVKGILIHHFPMTASCRPEKFRSLRAKKLTITSRGIRK